MAVCPVCGCRTDELDFVRGKVGNWSGNICSFCQKQLKSIESDATIGEAQLRWVNAAIAKDVAQRDEELLNGLLAMAGTASTAQPAEGVQYPIVKSYPPVGNIPVNTTPGFKAVDNDVIAQLTKRVEQLEKQIKAMKRTALIKSILEICLPIILGIIILIVFFSSGLFDALSGVYNEFV